ncbi:hypothetical protein SPI_01404 [Niveomyces insectorum RCEF 264]|uniref:Uncharacterized protein n=1 Tax=Niveomyces insectorum RCEF 264 TaxID=1081102 RepID=A0A167YXV8_9HYPO|nr:hypothetical protein SPI_01404 [Niveomyces insectorum RCEF 264]
MEMALQFLCKRYPLLFALESSGGDDNHPVFVNRVLGTRTPVGLDSPLHPLEVLFANVPEDFAVLLRSGGEDDGDGDGDGDGGGEPGSYCLRAAAVCSSVGWCIGQHRDQPLRDIHAAVTDYAARLAGSMDRYFARLPTDQPIQRGAWTLEAAEELFALRRAGADAADANTDTDTADVRLRCDWQTLRRLPLTGAVVFNYKAVFTPLAALRTEPYVPALLHRVLQDGNPRLVVPGKCLPHVRAAALPALAAWAAEQVQRGVVPANWAVRTLDEAPFYPGWAAAWHAAQGF